MKIPLFDIDGTLVKTTMGDVHGNALNAVFPEIFEIEASMAEIDYMGKIDPQIIAEVAELHGIQRKKAVEKLPEAFQVMKNYIQENKDKGEYLILPGVEELFVAIKKKHGIIGLLTGNVPEAPVMKLEKAHLWKYIDFGAYGSESTSLKRVELVEIARQKASNVLHRDVHLDELVIIGDTPRDIQCAKDGGITSIGVATGNYDRKTLEDAGADLVVNSLEEQGKILSFL